MLNDEQRGRLLHIARFSVERHVTANGTLEIAPDDLPEVSGVFVTLKRRGELRGCLGVLSMQASLSEEVARCARDSASSDPRFPPVTRDELPEISLQISVLGPLEAVDPMDENAFTIGRHGLVIEHGRHRGLLLPQVAVEWGWTREQFLRQTCHKAGLRVDAWQNGATVFRFTADVFGE